MSTPNFGTVYKRKVADTSNSSNPIVKDDEWDKKVVVITDDDTNVSKGETIKIVVKREQSDHYQALLSGQSKVRKPQYRRKSNVPIHHDGKYGQSVGETRSESHAMRSVDDRY